MLCLLFKITGPPRFHPLFLAAASDVYKGPGRSWQQEGKLRPGPHRVPRLLVDLGRTQGFPPRTRLKPHLRPRHHPQQQHLGHNQVLNHSKQTVRTVTKTKTHHQTTVMDRQMTKNQIAPPTIPQIKALTNQIWAEVAEEVATQAAVAEMAAETAVPISVQHVPKAGRTGDKGVQKSGTRKRNSRYRQCLMQRGTGRG